MSVNDSSRQKKAARKKKPPASDATTTPPPPKPSSPPSSQPSPSEGVAAAEDSDISTELNARYAELRMARSRAEEVLRRHRAKLFENQAVTGVAVDFRVKDGKIVRPLEYVISVMVESKQPQGHECFLTAGNELLPPTLDDVPVDVRQSIARSTASAIPEEFRFRDPLVGGCAIAPVTNPLNFGTLGMRVRFGNASMYLSNRHVTGEVGAAIQQPPSGEVPAPPRHIIGGVQFATGAFDAMVDAALIAPIGDRGAVDGILGLNGPFVVKTLTIGDERSARVLLVGARSGSIDLREALVINTDFEVRIPDIRISPTFQHQILATSTEPIVQPGDSGSILIQRIQVGSETVNLVVGLVVARYEEIQGTRRIFGVVANHFTDVISRLPIRLED